MDRLFSGTLEELAKLQQLLAEAAVWSYLLKKPAIAEALANPCEIGMTEVEQIIADKCFVVRFEWRPDGVAISCGEKNDGE